MIQGLTSEGMAILNGDDPNVKWMASHTKARIKTFGMDPTNDVWASEVELNWPRGNSFVIHTPNSTCKIQTRLLGETMVYPILAAVTVAVAEGFSLKKVIHKLETLETSPGRMELLTLTNGVTIIDDSFKAPIESYHAALKLLYRIPAKRRVLVMGHIEEPVGPQGLQYRNLGERVGKFVDLIYFAEHKRNFTSLRAGVSNAGMSRELVIHCPDGLQRLVERLMSELKEGDVVLVKATYANKFRRVSMMMHGAHVQCTVKHCKLKVFYCEQCPLVQVDTTTIRNPVITRLISH